MRLSTKTRYGVRAIFDIAFHAQDNPGVAAQAKEIARREDIPLRYLEQIFQELKRAGIVESKRGPRGGYYLKKQPSEITLGDVVTALQGPVEDMFTLEDEHGDGPPPFAAQVTRPLWDELTQHICEWFEKTYSVTFAELIQRGNDLGMTRDGAGQPMYFI